MLAAAFVRDVVNISSVSERVAVKLSHASNRLKGHEKSQLTVSFWVNSKEEEPSGSFLAKFTFDCLIPVRWSVRSMMKKPWLMLWPGSTRCPSPSRSCLTSCTTRREFTPGELRPSKTQQTLTYLLLSTNNTRLELFRVQS